MPKKKMTAAQVAKLLRSGRAGRGRDRYGSNAKRTTCGAGHSHPSKMEARVCDRLTGECAGTGIRIVQQASFPLGALTTDERGRALRFTPDFSLWDGQRWCRFVEAKSPRRVSRDFEVRKRAFEATYGVPVEVVDR